MLLSKSKLLTYRQCPRLYQYCYVDRLPIPPPSPEMLVGREVHEFAENFWNLVKINGDKITVDRKPTDNREVESIINNVIEMERRRLKVCQSKPNPLLYFKPMLTEKSIKLPELGITGILDRLDRELDDTFSIVEIKTSKHPNMNSDLRLELRFYKLLVDNSGLLEDKITNGVVYFPRFNIVKFEKITRMNLIEKEIKRVRSMIEAESFEPKITPLCGWCSFKQLCIQQGMEEGY